MTYYNSTIYFFLAANIAAMIFFCPNGVINITTYITAADDISPRARIEGRGRRGCVALGLRSLEMCHLT